jgi:hypothetical protein
MNEEFYALIKLVSGEEIFSKVCAFEENNEVLVVLDHPIFIEEMGHSNKLNSPIIKINPWISSTEETTFIISRDKIIMMTEIKDDRYIKMFNRYIREKNKVSNQTKITPNMGYITSIAEARDSLEKIYKMNVEFRTKE